jgi:hypothetical protein
VTLFAECDACKLARSIDVSSPLCSGCRHNKSVIEAAGRMVQSGESIIAALAALLAQSSLHAGDGPVADRLADVLSRLTELQKRTPNTGLTDEVQAIIDGASS